MKRLLRRIDDFFFTCTIVICVILYWALGLENNVARRKKIQNWLKKYESKKR